MKLNILAIIFLFTATIITACGGGNGESPSSSLAPHSIPSMYKDLSMEELKLKSSDIDYSHILGTSSGEVYKGGDDPRIAENILEHEGTLLFANGIIETVYPSSTEGLFTLWFCSSEKAVQFSSIGTVPLTGAQCVDPLFLLYDLTRGPKLLEGDIVNVVGIIVGYREKMTSGGVLRTLITNNFRPTISVIKAELVNQ